MTTKLNAQSATPACRHLGLAVDPFVHAEAPTEEHRCYLWMQRDLIDLDHQRNYCLSDCQADCPWLQVSMPGKRNRRGGSRADRFCAVLKDSGRRTGGAIAAFSMTVAAGVWVFLHRLAIRVWLLLCTLGVWVWENTPVVMARFCRALASGAGATLRGIGRGGLRLGHAIFQSREKRRLLTKAREKAKAGSDEDFRMLMRLGSEANTAGRRKEANLCFSRAAALNATSEEAWLWMAATADDHAEAQSCIEKALAINPSSGRGRAHLLGLRKPAVPAMQNEVLEEGMSAYVLIDHGLKAMDLGNEDQAHHFFAAATESDRSSETAWFWRAKTATDLAEVITCLERVLELNPDNRKAQASLTWATDRRRADGERQRMVESRAHGPVAKTSDTKPGPSRPPAVLQLASFGYLFLGLLWTAPVLLLLLDGSIGTQYLKIGFLPLLKMPWLSSAGLTDGLLPEFNLFYIAPIALALLCFVAMETVSSASRVNSFCAALVAGASAAGAGLFVARQPAFGTLLIVSIATGVTALAGRLDRRRRLRRQASEVSAHASENAQLAGGGRSKTVRV